MISSFDGNAKIKKEIEEIFWQTSSVSFTDEKLKEEFLYKYLGYYFEKNALIYYFEKEGKVLGYIVSAHQLDKNFLFKYFPYYKELTGHLETYKAHLHINCSKNSQGLGIGTLLLKHLEKNLQELNISGLHLITSSTARNVQFYQKNNYKILDSFLVKEAKLLILGKELASRIKKA